MKVHDKVRLMRNMKDITQEDMAVKLHMSTNGYSKIERGETNLQMDRLEQIADVFDIDVIELMSLGEKSAVFCTVGENNTNHGLMNVVGVEDQELVNQVSKLQMTVMHKEEIINHQKQEIESLKEIIELLKKN